MDFVRPLRPVALKLIAGRGHYETAIKALREARCSVWIATANLKELMVEDDRWSVRRKVRGKSAYRSIVGVFADLVEAGVTLRILHAAPPSLPFRTELRRHPKLLTAAPPLARPGTPVTGGAARRDPSFEMRACPRVHLKVVAVDGRFLYIGSANFTGAGLGAKGSGRRNFELGIVTDDELLLDDVQELFDGIWRGAECAGCTLRAQCPSVLATVESDRHCSRGIPSSPTPTPRLVGGKGLRSRPVGRKSKTKPSR